MKHIMLILLILFGTDCLLQAEIVTYPVPQPLFYKMHNDDYTVKVRHPGGPWVDLYEYNVQVDLDKPQDASMVLFDFSGTVEIRVQKNNGELHSVVVRPLSKGIVPVIDGNTLTFTLHSPQNLSVECNNDRLHNLHLFSNPLETDKPEPDAPGVMYFGPGLHLPTDTVKRYFSIPSNTTVYVAGGAVLNGQLLCDSVKNVVIRGRGILLHPQEGILVQYSKNITIRDLTLINPNHYSIMGGQSTGISISNFRSFSSRGWSDGLDFMSCSDVLIDNVFMRNSDDCIAIYGHRWNYYGDVSNYIVYNSTLWADIAHPINIGTHGNTETEGEVIENLHFSNIDILEHDEDDPDYQGCMAINVGDRNLARNITFDSIRIENLQEGQLFHLRVIYNKKYNTDAGRSISNVTFRNITYTGTNDNPSRIEGYDNRRTVSRITFENIRINGKKAASLSDMNIQTDRFTSDINIK